MNIAIIFPMCGPIYNSPGLYRRFPQYLRERFGSKVYKIGIDAGFLCPNRDGTKSAQGCIYCNNESFNIYIGKKLSLREQILKGREYARRRVQAEKFILYFQTYTNTYAPLEELKEKYGIIREFEDIVGLSIATRPDCIDDEKLDIIEEFSRDYEVWLEYGLQSIHRKTLDIINRNHYYEDFLKAVELTRKRKNIKICVHVIIGLPGEDKKMILETAKEMGRLKIDGIKIHPLYIVKNTRMESILRNGSYKPLSLEDYIDMAIDFLEFLCPQTVIQRLSADCPKEFLVAPSWIRDKQRVLSSLEDKMRRENRFQGKHYLSYVS